MKYYSISAKYDHDFTIIRYVLGSDYADKCIDHMIQTDYKQYLNTYPEITDYSLEDYRKDFSFYHKQEIPDFMEKGRYSDILDN